MNTKRTIWTVRGWKVKWKAVYIDHGTWNFGPIDSTRQHTWSPKPTPPPWQSVVIQKSQCNGWTHPPACSSWNGMTGLHSATMLDIAMGSGRVYLQKCRDVLDAIKGVFMYWRRLKRRAFFCRKTGPISQSASGLWCCLNNWFRQYLIQKLVHSWVKA
jgi:hypothetical protein